MKGRIDARRKLRAESLESRQLLHGGAMAGGGEPVSTAERVENAFQRFDGNEDAMISQDEVSERLWSRISAADTDASSTISNEELTAHLDALAAERGEDHEGDRRQRDRGRRGPRHRGERPGAEHRSVEERIDNFFTSNDANEDGLITADEVSERLWERLATADLDENGVSRDEVLAQHDARQQERFDAMFARLDSNEDGGVTVDEVSARRWEHISAADADGNGSVTSTELQNHIEAQRAEREAEREAREEMENDNEVDPDGEAVGEANQTGRRGFRGNRVRGRR